MPSDLLAAFSMAQAARCDVYEGEEPCGKPAAERLVFCHPWICTHVHPEGAIDVCAAHFLAHLAGHLLINEPTRMAIREEEVVRVSGEAVCPDCGSSYAAHPEVEGWPTFHRGCRDTLLKL